MAWPEIQEHVAEGKTTAFLVAASVEQHGPHLACETDCWYGEEMALRVARRLGHALVAPVIRPGCSEHHMGFPGTFTIPPDLLVAVVRHHLRCLAESGFTHVVLTSSHGGNFGPLREALPGLREHCSELGIQLTPVLDLGAFVAALTRAPLAHGLDQGMPAVQADLVETSLALALRPETVHMELAAPGYLGDFELDDLFRLGLKRITANGVLGDPTQATAELGSEILDSLEAYLAEAVQRGGIP
ncbi:MAG: creatininase family protein [Chloroflexota bacterium]